MKTPLRHSESHKELPNRVNVEGMLKPVKEETPSVSSRCNPQSNLFGTKNEYPWNRLEKSSFSSCRFPIEQLEIEEPVSTFSKSLDKSGLNSTTETTSALGGLTQPTVKVHPLDQPQTPLAKKLSWTGHSTVSAIKVQEPVLGASSSSSTQNEGHVASGILSAKLHTEPVSNVQPAIVPKPPIQNYAEPVSNINPATVSKPLHPEPPKPIIIFGEGQPVASNQGHVELQRQLSLPVSCNNLPPVNSRPPPKSKQIAVNGKLFTVMKPLGRGGSSVVYQVVITNVYPFKNVHVGCLQYSLSFL